MFVLTENNEILNLASFRGINIGVHQNMYRLEAYMNKTGGFPGIDLEIIAIFDDEEKAQTALRDLATAISAAEQLWDANAYNSSG